VKDGVRFRPFLLQYFDRFDRWEDEQFNVSAFGFALHRFHHRQSAHTGAND